MSAAAINLYGQCFIFREGKAFSLPNDGYFGTFSWWRSFLDRRIWTVRGFDEFCQSGKAVIDDFGNLVRVPE